MSLAGKGNIWKDRYGISCRLKRHTVQYTHACTHFTAYWTFFARVISSISPIHQNFQCTVKMSAWYMLITLAERYFLITFYLMGFKLCMIHKYNCDIMLVMLFFTLGYIIKGDNWLSAAGTGAYFWLMGAVLFTFPFEYGLTGYFLFLFATGRSVSAGGSGSGQSSL